jgi:thiamine biosynthesis lipoprotein
MTSSSALALLLCACAACAADRFEVASVHAVRPPARPARRVVWSPGQVRYEEESLRDLLFLAYRVQFFQLDPPSWTDGAYFTVVAKPPAGATRDDLPAMLRTLLAERFGLQLHHETRRMAGYEVTVGPEAPKLSVSDSASPAGAMPRHFDLDRDGFAILPPGQANVVILPPRDGVTHVTGARQTAAALCGLLSRELQQPVVDRTGLTGRYDFRLAYALESSTDPAPTLVQAVEHQLGLRMPRAKVPVDVLVIDRLSRTPSEEPERFEAVEPHMGTLVRIQLYAAEEAEAAAAFRLAFARIAELDAALSDYRPESELNRLCRAAAGRPVAIGPDLMTVLAASQRLAEESGGAFDVTIGPVTDLWRQHRVPDAAALRDATARTGYRKLHLDAAHGTATLDEAGMQLDLGGIAKGYAADQALAVLRKLGLSSALVAMSGDLAIGAAPPGKAGWTVAAGIPARTLELANAAVSTSGDTEQHLDAGGVRYSHIVDPATGMGLTHAPVVTVIARRGIEADALATAVSILGLDRGRALAARYGARVMP